jgi:DNA sulfur modification protein DndE
MFTHIKTSTENKIIVSELTRKFNLGTENLIARIAFCYSLKSGVKFNPMDVKDSGGKEYSKSVLFGNHYPIYLAMICTHYQADKYNKDIPRFIKMHIDDGLELINKEVVENPNLIGFDYLLDKIESGLIEIC